MDFGVEHGVLGWMVAALCPGFMSKAAMSSGVIACKASRVSHPSPSGVFVYGCNASLQLDSHFRKSAGLGHLGSGRTVLCPPCPAQELLLARVPFQHTHALLFHPQSYYRRPQNMLNHKTFLMNYELSGLDCVAAELLVSD